MLLLPLVVLALSKARWKALLRLLVCVPFAPWLRRLVVHARLVRLLGP
jgi:hypothetical protein